MTVQTLHPSQNDSADRQIVLPHLEQLPSLVDTDSVLAPDGEGRPQHIEVNTELLQGGAADRTQQLVGDVRVGLVHSRDLQRRVEVVVSNAVIHNAVGLLGLGLDRLVWSRIAGGSSDSSEDARSAGNPGRNHHLVGGVVAGTTTPSLGLGLRLGR